MQQQIQGVYDAMVGGQHKAVQQNFQDALNASGIREVTISSALVIDADASRVVNLEKVFVV